MKIAIVKTVNKRGVVHVDILCYGIAQLFTYSTAGERGISITKCEVLVYENSSQRSASLLRW